MKNPDVIPQITPLGPERVVRPLGSATIAGAPVAYVIMMAAVVAVLSFVPFSVVMSAGSSFPMSQGIYPLTGWLLGPWAGAVASGAGTLVGVFLAPHTAGIPWLSVAGAASASLFAGALVPRGRHGLWAVLAAVVLASVVIYYRHAVGANGVKPLALLLAYLTHVAAILLFLLPTRAWIGRMIASANLKILAVGLFFGTWCAASLMIFEESMISYLLLNWPSELFTFFAVVVPIEHAIRSGIGAVIGTGVIAGLRAMALVKPPGASF